MRKKESIIQKIAYWLKVVSLGVILGLGIQFTQAWTNPNVTPPGGNVAGPITTGVGNQVKSASLGLLGNLVVTGIAKIGQSAVTCDTTLEGFIGYNTSKKCIEYCDGTGSWKCMNGGSGVACAAENMEIKSDQSYTVPPGITALTIIAKGGGGGGGAEDTSYNGQGAGGGGTGGNTCVFKSSGSVLLVKGNGGNGGDGTGDVNNPPASAGSNGNTTTQVINVTPGESLDIKVGGGGGGGWSDYVHWGGPRGGNGVHTGGSCQNPAVAGANNWGSGGTGSTLKGGNGTDSGVDSNYFGTGGTAPSLSFGTGAGGAVGRGGRGGDGGSVIIRTPTASELSAAGLSTYCL